MNIICQAWFELRTMREECDREFFGNYTNYVKLTFNGIFKKILSHNSRPVTNRPISSEPITSE